MANRNKKKYLIILTAVLFITFLFLSISVSNHNNWVINFDKSVQNFARANVTNGKTVFYKLITHFGDVPILLAITLSLSLYLIFKKQFAYSFWYFFNLLIGAGLGHVLLKEIFRRSRPDIEHYTVETSYSFPSGHSMGAMLGYGSIIYLLYCLKQSNKKFYTLTIGLSLLILIIGFSRIYLGVHYPSDVLGGYLAGIIWLLISILVLKKFEKKHSSEKRYMS